MTMYAVHSVVRGRSNRTARAQAPMHGGFKQYVGTEQRRLVRGRPVEFTEAQLLRDLQELRQKESDGLLEVRTSDGRLVDLTTLEPAPMPAPVPTKIVLLDSVALDTQNVGQAMPQFPGGNVQLNIPQEFIPEQMEVPVSGEMSFQEAEDLTRRTAKAKRR